ncbi:MAG: ligand-binding sensor domain-containing protein [Thermoanaerobaculia bacterium]
MALLVTSSAHGASAHFARLSVPEGLSQSSVESIAEDRYGFLWFGTQEGLNRFDGYRFDVYQPSRKRGDLRDGFIRAITPGPRGDLWIGTASGLQHLDVATGRFSESVTPPGIGVRLNTVRVGPDGRLWFAGSNGGLWTRAAEEGALAQPVASDVVAPDTRVTAVALDESGTLWIAADRHLFAGHTSGVDGALSLIATPALEDAGIIGFIHVESGILWIGRHGAPVLRFDPKNGATTEYPDLPRFVLTFASAGEGRLWIGGRGVGVSRFDPATGEIITYRHEPGMEESLADDDVAVVYQDRGGSLWVGAWNGGLSRLDLYSQAFRSLRNVPGDPGSLPDDDVTRMTEGPDGRLWVMTRDDVLAVGDTRKGSFVTIPFEGDLTAIAFGGANLFAGTTSGLVELDPTSGRPLPAREAIKAAGLDRVGIVALAGGDDHLWVVAEGTLYRLTTATGSLQRVDLPTNDEPTSLYASSPETLWIAHAGGSLSRAEFGGGALSVRRVGDGSLAARGRLSAVAEHGGIVWVGAARGIGRLGPPGGRVEWVDLERGMPSRSVASIVPDDEGLLWIATERGITRFDPSTGRAVHFGPVQGAQASGYVEGGAARGRSGLLYFAGRGITAFDPQRVLDNPYRPRVVFTALEILHRPVLPSWRDPDSPLSTAIHASDEVTLGPDAVVFSVEMAAPGVSDPEGVRFVHRLDGFDADWIETNADRRVATYTRLAPGRYVLRARARTQSGVWSVNEATLRIRILPPWWRTPAAVVLWIVLVALLLASIILEARRRTRVSVALAEQEALRRASVTDPLTGLYNRRFLAEWLKHEVPRILRTHRRSGGSEQDPEFLLFVAADLDNLKQINDEFGHDAGDRAICAVADLLQSHARADDIAVRLGGDEFLFVLRSVDRSRAAQVVERLRASVDSLELGLESPARATISLGFASFPFVEREVEALTWEQTLQLADRALLHSKRRGRNAWTGFLSTPRTSAAAVLQQAGAGEIDPSLIRIVEGPEA